MRRLRSTEGTPAHRRAARYHMAKCRQGTAPLFAALRAEMADKYAYMNAKAREVEDAEDSAVDAMADADSAEIALENVLRDIDADLVKLDRSDPALNAQKAVFPGGYGKEIAPEGQEQLSVLSALRTRLVALKAHPVGAAALEQFDKAEAGFRAALAAEEKATAKVDGLFAEEQAARRAVREQLESAHGRLRDLYRSRPSLAEAFFLRDKAGRTRADTGATDGASAPHDKGAQAAYTSPA